jgi:hypothetical protein
MRNIDKWLSDSNACSLKTIECKIGGFDVHEDLYCSILDYDGMKVLYSSEMLVPTHQSVGWSNRKPAIKIFVAVKTKNLIFITLLKSDWELCHSHSTLGFHVVQFYAVLVNGIRCILFVCLYENITYTFS